MSFTRDDCFRGLSLYLAAQSSFWKDACLFTKCYLCGVIVVGLCVCVLHGSDATEQPVELIERDPDYDRAAVRTDERLLCLEEPFYEGVHFLS